jgi:hypothetical protein
MKRKSQFLAKLAESKDVEAQIIEFGLTGQIGRLTGRGGFASKVKFERKIDHMRA